MPKSSLKVEKVTQACAYLLRKSRNGRMGYIKALKMLYFFEREMMRQTGFPAFDDEFFIMKHGPVLSNTMDLMTEQPAPGEHSIWHQFIETQGYDLVLSGDCPADLLSAGEREILDSLANQYANMTRWQVVRIADELPENERIESGRIPLSAAEIFQRLGYQPARNGYGPRIA